MSLSITKCVFVCVAAILSVITDHSATRTWAEAGKQELPVSPLARRYEPSRPTRPGCIQLSNGELLFGNIYLTRDKELSIYDRTLKQHRRFPLSLVKRIEAEPEEEHVEKEWRWKQEGSDEKVYTGRSYPWRKYLTILTLTDGTKITGDLSAVVYLCDRNGSQQKFILHKRQKGEPVMSREALTYVKVIILGISGQWGNPTGGLRSMVWSESKTFKVGKPVIVHFALNNASSIRQAINLNNLLDNLRIELTGPDGQLCPEDQREARSPATLHPRIPGEKNRMLHLEKGQSYAAVSYDVAKLFDLSRGGSYSVRYVCEAYRPDRTSKLSSNTLTIKLVQKQPGKSDNIDW